jgi:cell wall-associated NlpC family hydrolase
VLATPSGADPIADKRAEAARIAATLEAKGNQLSTLDEEYNQARLRADRTAGQVQAVKAMVEQTNQLVRQARVRLRGHAVDAYLRGGQSPMAQLLDSRSADEVAVRQIYVRTLVGSEQAAIDALDAALELRDARRSDLEAAQRSARSVLTGLSSRRQAAADAAAAQEATLAKVKGDLGGLVAAEAQRRAAEEARKAQANSARLAQAVAQGPTRKASLPPASHSLGLGTALGAARPPAEGAAAAVAEAKRQIGKPYRYGASGPDAFDCSGLTMWSWRAGGRSLPHSSSAQYGATSRVALSAIQPGDLVFYGSPIHHVGIYVGGGQMVEASETGTPVRYASIYRRDLVGVGRVG